MPAANSNGRAAAPPRARPDLGPCARALCAAAVLFGSLLLAIPGVSAARGPSAVLGDVTAKSALDGALLDGSVLVRRSPASRMVLIRAGHFMMGSSTQGVLEAFVACQREPLGHRCVPTLFADEQPKHRVVLDDYWMDRTEVTVADYERCVFLRHCPRHPMREGRQRFARPNYPVTFVSWQEAQTYCEFRGARLPTEAEWERAARGREGRRYPWGNLFNPRFANHGRFGLDRSSGVDGYRELAPVGSFPEGSTPDGLLDLAGNVSEWVLDRRAPYTEKAVKNPRVTAHQGKSAERVVRGGDWASGHVWLRGASREALPAEARLPTLGFRCARSTTETPP